MFSNKSVKRERQKITLARDAKILSKDLEAAETFNVFFSNIVKKMSISFGQD